MKKKLLIATIPIVVLLLGLAGALLFLVSQPEEDVYTQNITQAKSFFDAGEYDKAITFYENALKADDTQEEPYYQIAMIYHKQGKLSDAISILQRADGKVKSDRIKNLLASYLGEQNEGLEVKNDVAVEAENAGTFNESLLKIFNTYSYDTYSKTYTLENETFESNLYTVKYLNLDIDFHYIQNEKTGNILNESTHRPLDSVRPTEIHVNDLELLISGVSTGVSLDKLKSRGITNLIQEYDKSHETNVLKFDFSNCKFTVACDENGRIIGRDSYNVVVPLASTIVSERVHISGVVVSATTAAPVSRASLTFRTGWNVRVGASYGSTDTNSGGEYSMYLDPGDYTVEISAG
ncbi:MAG: tetratricopeptide repeat protein, partial [Ruminococcus sp.]|nr:tetratricopeptide repeat protein [Ruminococcus sp.]